jgi:hypothetical protein
MRGVLLAQLMLQDAWCMVWLSFCVRAAAAPAACCACCLHMQVQFQLAWMGLLVQISAVSRACA